MDTTRNRPAPAPPVGSAHGTDYRTPQPFRESVSRRRFLRAGAAVAGAAGVASQLGGCVGPAGVRPAAPSAATGTIADLRHVVILMMENRAFDHYYGTLRGVRGFGDNQALRFPNGDAIFRQPDASRADGGYLLPFHMDSAKVNAQNAGDLDHSWHGDHDCRNSGAWNKWVPAKTGQTMGYFTRADLPFNYALADAFTICDNYHQAVLGPTVPNRLVFWSGTNGGKTANPGVRRVLFSDITTYPELLLRAGVSFQVYTNHEVGDGTGDDAWVGDYGCNPLWFYQAYLTSMNASTAAGRRLAIQGAVQPWQASQGVPLGPNHVNHVLAQFQADCAAGTLPAVSWVVMPHMYSEHPSASPSYGAHYVRAVIEALMGNQALWQSSALFITYDEHDGYFDHAIPPAPEPGTAGEFISSQPIGFGPRVPMLICSPWTRGGHVDSNTYDHTSMLRFLQAWTGVAAANISAWRRSVSGDLTAAFDFASPDYTVPALPDTVPLITASDAEKGYPAVRPPPAGAQAMPAQEPGTRPHRRSIHMAHADATVDRSAGTVTATMTSAGQVGVSLQVYPDKYQAFAATPATVTSAAPRTYTWNAAQTSGKYAFSVYGPDGFVRSFAGAVVAAGADAGQVPDVAATPVTGTTRALRITLANHGRQPVTFTLTASDYSGTTRTATVTSGRPVTIAWPVNAEGYHDVIITANTSDGFTRRYAGRIS